LQNKTLCTKRLGERLKELSDKGCAVDLSLAEEIDLEAESLQVEQGAGGFESRIFELPDGGVGYIIYVRVFNRTSRTIYCDDIDLRVFGDDQMFDWMPDPRETKRPESYQFRGKGSPEFPREQVLNHVLLGGHGALAPRRPFEGYLLATGKPMPQSLRDGETLDAAITIFLSDGVSYTATIQLRVERRAAKPKLSPRGQSKLWTAVEGHVGSNLPLRSAGDSVAGIQNSTGPRVSDRHTVDADMKQMKTDDVEP
jgi:hypothetical protein